MTNFVFVIMQFSLLTLKISLLIAIIIRISGMGQFTNKHGILMYIFRRIIDMLEIMIIYSHTLLSRKLLNHEILADAYQ